MSKNPFGKGRTQEKPYAIYKAEGFEWRVLKTYKLPANEEKDPYARWFMATQGPGTFGSFELGDGYAKDTIRYGLLVAGTTDWIAAFGGRSNLLMPLRKLD